MIKRNSYECSLISSLLAITKILTCLFYYISAEVQRTNFQNDKLKQEVNDLRNRLEETEWGLCQKTGEIALLKTQLKECQVSQVLIFPRNIL